MSDSTAPHVTAPFVPIEEVLKFDKGPSKPSRDMPARIALARISNAVNPIVQAYDKLAAAAAILGPGITSKGADGHVEEAGHIGKNQTDSTVATKILSAGKGLHSGVDHAKIKAGDTAQFSGNAEDGLAIGVTQATTTIKKPVDLTSNGEQDEGKELEQQKTAADHVKDRQFKPNDRGDMGQNSGAKASQFVTEGEL
ncbi:hypothetical protein A4A49_30019 [Nicotiana attenuata]|uniref:Uncharacterized protein n=1 Tax=Nicotiana attenuata TaxID=49451 RepID=A0A1J6IHQ2_NICAT|nr:hypothetical protein A4A49_30019 [Nicotiana attenuata]